MSVESGLYVRVFMLCDGAAARGEVTDILGIVGVLQAPKGFPIEDEKTVMLVIERNNDRAAHSMDLEWVLPNRKILRVLTALPVPEESGAFPLRLPIRFRQWEPGTYRLRLCIAGTVVAFVDIEFREKLLPMN